MWLTGVGAGLVGLVASERMPAWDYFWRGGAAALLRLRHLLLADGDAGADPRGLEWNPILQGIEWVRAGFFTGYDPPWLDRGYALRFAVVLLLLGLCLERADRRRLRRAEA